MKSIKKLFENNRKWSEDITKKNPDFFPTLSKQQAPKYLWIGCADSRVPANEVVGLLPGELFVHRNVANVVIHTDLNCLSVMQYAIEVLKVEHVIVCGHYGCGGVIAALNDNRYGLIDNWLRHVKDVKERHGHHISLLKDQKQKEDCLCRNFHIFHTSKKKVAVMAKNFLNTVLVFNYLRMQLSIVKK